MLWEQALSATPPLSELSQGAWALITVVGLAAALHPASWQVLGYFTTLVHEAGHAVAGVSVGRRITGISLQGSMAGHTMSVGRSSGLGLMWSSWWGYPSPALAAWGYLAAADAGRSNLALAVTALMLALTLLLCRSLGALAVTAGALLALLGVLYLATPLLTVGVVYALGWLLLVGAVRGVAALVAIDLLGHQGTEGESDARALARLSLVPGLVWILSFILAVGFFGLQALQLVWAGAEKIF